MKADPFTKFPFQNELLNIIKNLVPLHSVYLISFEKEKTKRSVYLLPHSSQEPKRFTYTILIISQKAIAKNLNEVMTQLCRKMPKQFKAYAIFYSLADIISKLDYGNNFLNNVITKAPCIFKDDDELLRYKRPHPLYYKKLYNNIEDEWNCRMTRASYFLSVVDVYDLEEDLAVKMGFLNFALEHTCVALLYVFWEFKPTYYKLDYLMYMCGHFTNLPKEIFHRKTYKSHRLYNTLCNAYHLMRYSSNNKVSYEILDTAYKLCERFFQEAEVIGEKHLEKLKKLHCKNTIAKT